MYFPVSAGLLHSHGYTNMFSLISKGKNLRLIKTCVGKGKFLNSVKPKRTLFTSKILDSKQFIKLKKTQNDKHEYVRSVKDPPTFGKIVGLDLDDVKSTRESNSQVKVKRIKKKKLENLEDRVESYNAKTVEKFSDVEEEFSSDNEVNENDEHKENIEKPKLKLYENSNTLLRSVMLNLKSKTKRLAEQKVIIEGKRIIKDAISAGFQPQVIFFSRKSDIEMFNFSDSVKLCKIPYKTLQLWSDVTTCQGVIGVFKMPNLSELKEKSDCIPLTVICDNIREPSNMGGILRVVAAVGCKKLILTKGCVDIWESKVLRVAAGAHFHIPAMINLDWMDIRNEVVGKNKIILAEMENNSFNKSEPVEEGKEESNDSIKNKSSVYNQLPQVSYDSVSYENENVVIIIGGETYGISDEAYRFAEEREGVRAYIPMYYNIECLNSAVALGILSYEVRRQMAGASTNKSEQDSVSKGSSDESQVLTYNSEQTFPYALF